MIQDTFEARNGIAVEERLEDLERKMAETWVEKQYEPLHAEILQPNQLELRERIDGMLA